jgi:hypothetical protein
VGMQVKLLDLHLMLKIFAPIIFASNYFQVNENAPILENGITISRDSK